MQFHFHLDNIINVDVESYKGLDMWNGIQKVELNSEVGEQNGDGEKGRPKKSYWLLILIRWLKIMDQNNNRG